MFIYKGLRGFVEGDFLVWMLGRCRDAAASGIVVVVALLLLVLIGMFR